MPAISAGDLALLRGENHRLRVYMSVLRPRILWNARVNDAGITRGEQTIAFDTGSAGDGSFFAQVEANQTVWVGSTAGAKDVGKVRIKSISSGDGGVTGTLVVNANELDWTDSDYLTFHHNYELWAVYPRIDSSEIFYKDWDVDGGITYTDQNSQPPPITIAGPHQAKFMSSGTVSFDIPIGNSYAMAPGATISNRTVTVFPSAGVTVNPISGGVITVDITVAGQYWAKCTATDSNGKSQISYRCLFAHDPDPSDITHPFRDFQSLTLAGDWNKGGWAASIKTNDNASLTNLPDNALTIIWQVASYGTTSKDISLLSEGSNILICGYLRGDTINVSPQSGGDVDFKIATIDESLRSHLMFSIPLEANATPSTWYHYLNGYLTAGRIIHFIYRWHSTLLHIADFYGLASNTIHRKAVDLPKGNLYAMGDNFSKNHGIVSHLVSNKAGMMYMARDVAFLDDASRAAATVVAKVNKQDIGDAVTIIHAPTKTTAFVFLSGIYYDGTDANATGSTAPGSVPSSFGAKDYTLEHQMLSGQAHANQLSGQIYAVENNEYPEVRIKIKGNYLGVLDIALQEWWRIDVASGDSLRQIVWTDQNMIIRNLSALIDPLKGSVTVDVHFETEVDGTDGVTYLWPDTVPTIGGDLPTIPPAAGEPGAIVTSSSLYYLPYSESTWLLRTSDAINDAAQDPYWRTAGKQNTDDPRDAIIYTAEDGRIRKSTDSGQTFSTLSPGNPPNDAGDSPAPTLADVDFTQIEPSVAKDGTFVWIGRWKSNSGIWRSWLLHTDDNGSTWDWTSLGGGPVAGTVDVSTGSTQATTNVQYTAMAQMSSDRFLFLFIDDGGAHAVLVEYDGSAFTELDEIAMTGDLDFNLIRLTDTKALAVYETSGPSTVRARVIETTADTLSLGTQFSIDTIAYGPSLARANVSTKAYVAYYYSTDGDTVFQELAISGTTVSKTGTRQVITGDLAFDIKLRSIDPDGGAVTALLICYRNFAQSNKPYAQRVVISPSFSAGSQKELDSVAMSTTFNIQQGERALAPITPSSSTFVYVYVSATNQALRAIAIDASSSPLTTGTILVSTSNSLAPSIDTHGSDLLIVYGSDNGSGVLRAFTISVSGTTITDNADDFVLEAGAGPSSCNATNIISLTSSTAFAASSTGGNLNYYGISISSGAPSEFLALGAAIGKGLAAKAYITGIQSGELVLKAYLLATMTIDSEWSLGFASIAQALSREYWAYPFAVAGDDDAIIVFGRMNNPASYGDPVHMMYSLDAGATFLLMENSFGDDHIGAVIDDIYGTLYIARNIAGTSPKIYTAFPGGILALLNTVPIDGGINPQALRFDFNDNLLAGVNVGKSVMIMYCAPYYVRWEDFTFNHGTASGINSIIVL